MDHETVAQVLLRERGKLYGYIWSLVRDSAAAEDVFQDVCLLAIRECGQIDDPAHLLPWARRVARQQAINHLRRQQHAPRLLDPAALDLLDETWSTEDATPMAELLQALGHCLDQLTEKSRRLIKLRYADGHATAKVAEIVGSRVETVYQALWRIHTQLARCVERRMAEDEGDAAHD